MCRPPGRSDSGAGLVSTIFGFGIFVVTLLIALQVSVGLWRRSAVSAAAYDAARIVAGSDAGATPDATSAADEQLRRELGPAAERAVIEWSLGTDTVRLTVRVPEPSLLPPLLSHPLDLDWITSGVVVRRERVR